MPDCGTISPGLYSCAMVSSNVNFSMIIETEVNQAPFLGGRWRLGEGHGAPPDVLLRQSWASTMRIATFNVNGVNGRLPVLLRWLRGGQARRRLPSGAEGAGGEVPRRRCERRAMAPSGTDKKAGTASPSSRAATEPIETRRGLPGDPDDTPQPLHRSGGRRGASSAVSIFRTAIPRRGRSSTTSSAGSSA